MNKPQRHENLLLNILYALGILVLLVVLVTAWAIYESNQTNKRIANFDASIEEKYNNSDNANYLNNQQTPTNNTRKYISSDNKLSFTFSKDLYYTEALLENENAEITITDNDQNLISIIKDSEKPDSGWLCKGTDAIKITTINGQDIYRFKPIKQEGMCFPLETYNHTYLYGTMIEGSSDVYSIKVMDDGTHQWWIGLDTTNPKEYDEIVKTVTFKI